MPIQPRTSPPKICEKFAGRRTRAGSRGTLRPRPGTARPPAPGRRFMFASLAIFFFLDQDWQFSAKFCKCSYSLRVQRLHTFSLYFWGIFQVFSPHGILVFVPLHIKKRDISVSQLSDFNELSANICNTSVNIC